MHNMQRLLLRRATTPLHSHSHSRPDADTLIRAKDIQSIITDRQTDRQTTTASSQAQAVLRALLAGTRQATLVSMDGVAARSLAARPHSSFLVHPASRPPASSCLFQAAEAQSTLQYIRVSLSSFIDLEEIK